MNSRKEKLIQQLGLIPHPEVGYYKETYLSEGSISQGALPADYSGDRSYSKGIYFMLTAILFLHCTK